LRTVEVAELDHGAAREAIIVVVSTQPPSDGDAGGPGDPLRAIERTLRARGVRVVDKSSSRLQRAIDRALTILSFGRMRGYMARFVTTIGRTIYVPSDWERWPIEARASVLRHELVHVDQFERYGLVPMAIAYSLLPLPVGLAWCRMRLEREAYEETLRAAYERGGRAAAEALCGDIKRRFVGPDYLWMWPFPRAIDRFLRRAIEALDRERGSSGII
jgi:hypothetical protein